MDLSSLDKVDQNKENGIMPLADCDSCDCVCDGCDSCDCYCDGCDCDSCSDCVCDCIGCDNCFTCPDTTSCQDYCSDGQCFCYSCSDCGDCGDCGDCDCGDCDCDCDCYSGNCYCRDQDAYCDWCNDRISCDLPTCDCDSYDCFTAVNNIVKEASEAAVQANYQTVKSAMVVSSGSGDNNGSSGASKGDAITSAISNYNGLSIKINALQEAMKRVLEQDNLNLIAADVSVRSIDSLLVYYMAAMKNMLLLSSAIHYFRRCRFFEDQACRQFVCDCICDCVCNDCGGYCYVCQQYTPCDCDCDCDSCGDCDCTCQENECFNDPGCSDCNCDCYSCPDGECYCDCIGDL